MSEFGDFGLEADEELGNLLKSEKVNKSMKLAIGIDLGGTNMRVALVDYSGKILKSASEKTPVQSGPRKTMERLAAMTKELLGSDEALGVGVGSPGPLSRQRRFIYESPNLPGFENFPLGESLEKLSGLPVWLDGDAKCATYGEWCFGAATRMKNFILLTFGTGVGGGIISEARMIYGQKDGAGELGHLTLYPDGRPCNCGNLGCLEQYLSAVALSRRGGEALGRVTNPQEIFESFAKHEEWAQLTLKSFARDIAIALASLANIFNPEAFVLGGGIFSTGGGPLVSLIEGEMKDRCFASTLEGLKILPSALAGNAGVLGAASLVFRAFEPDPHQS